jgi:hypothetical protein
VKKKKFKNSSNAWRKVLKVAILALQPVTLDTVMRWRVSPETKGPSTKSGVYTAHRYRTIYYIGQIVAFHVGSQPSAVHVLARGSESNLSVSCWMSGLALETRGSNPLCCVRGVARGERSRKEALGQTLRVARSLVI